MARAKNPMDPITKDIHKDVRIFLNNRDIKWTDIIEWSTGMITASNEDEVVFQFPDGQNWRYAGIHVCVAKRFDKRRSKPAPSKIRITITAVVEYEPNAEHYEDGSSLEQMLKVDLSNANEDTFLFLDNPHNKWHISGEVV